MRTGRISMTITACSLAAWLAAPALAASDAEPDPYTAPDDTWITLGGEVTTVGPNTFSLDYGDGAVIVEMDDGDRDADAYKLIAGDEVTVTGKVDDDLFEATTIEAGSVYVKKLGTFFYASALDEEDRFIAVSNPWLAAPAAIVQGTVTAVGDEELVLSTGTGKLTVETDELGFDPLDDIGYPRIDVGDMVRVTGQLDTDLFEGRVLEADTVVEITS